MNHLRCQEECGMQTWYGYDVLPLMHQPSKGKLPRSAIMLFRQQCHSFKEDLILLQVLTFKSWIPCLTTGHQTHTKLYVKNLQSPPPTHPRNLHTKFSIGEEPYLQLYSLPLAQLCRWKTHAREGCKEQFQSQAPCKHSGSNSKVTYTKGDKTELYKRWTFSHRTYIRCLTGGGSIWIMT